MASRTESPAFKLVTGGINADYGQNLKAPYPCPPNTGFCGPRIICRPQTEGAPCNPAGRVIRIPNCSPEFQSCPPRSGPGPCPPALGGGPGGPGFG